MKKSHFSTSLFVLLVLVGLLSSCDDETIVNDTGQLSLNTSARNPVGIEVGTDFEVTVQPANGTLSARTSKGMIFYAANEAFTGVDKFSYIDEGLTYEVSLQVSSENPICSQDSLIWDNSTPMNTNLVLDLINDGIICDENVDASTIHLVTGDFWEPDHGSISLNGTVLTYTPDADYVGEDSFGFVFTHSVAGIYGIGIIVNVEN